MSSSPLLTPWPAQQHLRAHASLPLDGPQLLLLGPGLLDSPTNPWAPLHQETANPLDWMGFILDRVAYIIGPKSKNAANSAIQRQHI